MVDLPPSSGLSSRGDSALGVPEPPKIWADAS